MEKEFKQILRNKFLSKLIFVLPVTTIVIFPFVTNQDVQDVKLAVVDQDHSPLSERLVQKASDSGYFRLADVSPTYEEAMRSIETGDADIVFQIPQDFERDLYRLSGRGGAGADCCQFGERNKGSVGGAIPRVGR